ncbi:MAG: EamA family transporter, partial [Flavobacteriales bacterium]
MTVNQKGFLFVFLMSLAWALNVVVAGYAIITLKVNAFVYGGQTLLTAASLFAITIVLRTNKKIPKLKVTYKDIIWMLLLGVLSNGIGNYFGLQGIENSPTNYAFLIKTSIVYSIILEIILGQKEFSIARIILGFLLLIGAYLISSNGVFIIPQKEDIYTIIAAG